MRQILYIARMLMYAALLSASALPGSFAYAQPAYPASTPTYIPTAVLSQVSLTAVGDVSFAAHRITTLSVRLSGTGASIVAAIQASNDPLSVSDANATWTTITANPVPTGSGVTSLTANGFWTANIAGMTRARLHVTGLASGTLRVNMAGG